MKNVSILIPNYNGEKFIMETIRLLAEGIPGVEIVVVDDRSTDCSVELLKESGIEVVERKKNGGFAAAVNEGLLFLQSRKFEYVLVCNSDLTPSESECKKIIRALEVEFADAEVGVIGFQENNNFKPSNRSASDISGFLFWIRIELLKTVGLFEEKFFMYGEETEYFRRVLAKGYKIKQSEVQVSHATEKSGKSKMMNSWFAIRNCLYLELKDNRLKEAFKKLIVLILVMVRLRGDKNDPSTKRIRRPGILVGLLMLVGSLIWNIYQMLASKATKWLSRQ